jgi:hypothetical protein
MPGKVSAVATPHLLHQLERKQLIKINCTLTLLTGVKGEAGVGTTDVVTLKVAFGVDAEVWVSDLVLDIGTPAVSLALVLVICLVLETDLALRLPFCALDSFLASSNASMKLKSSMWLFLAIDCYQLHY